MQQHQESKLYYRLAEVNLDGTRNYSKVIVMTTKATFTIKIVSNPIKNIAAIIASESILDASVLLFDASGKVLKTYNKNIFKDMPVDINISNFSKELYMIKIQSKHLYSESVKLVKL